MLDAASLLQQLWIPAQHGEWCDCSVLNRDQQLLVMQWWLRHCLPAVQVITWQQLALSYLPTSRYRPVWWTSCAFNKAVKWHFSVAMYKIPVIYDRYVYDSVYQQLLKLVLVFSQLFKTWERITCFTAWFSEVYNVYVLQTTGGSVIKQWQCNRLKIFLFEKSH